jgi:hypothetical protein
MMIRIWLSSAQIGDMADERDFDLWARYVSETIATATGIAVDEIDQGAFGATGADSISGGTEEQRQELREWLSVTGWEAFCSGAWQAMAAAKDH